jgi:glycosyltransferase involved in cell wall biosynthesis
LTPKIRKTYQLPAKYILYVGDINWNKNVVGLIDVFTALKSRDVHLVLVGKVFQDRPDIPEYREIQAHIAQSKKRNQIHTLGYVPSHHLGAIYHAALLYCQPSWDEGFGLPVLEAMKAGCPVVSSSRGSLSEIGGEGVRYIDPADQSAWRETLEKVIASATLRDTLRALGYAQVKKYRWEDTARATRAIYAHVLAQATP